jgi:translation elongation factor P/translation initiation factor 5A
MATVTAKEIKKGSYIKVNDVVYRILRKEVVVCGTHSHSKNKIICKPVLGGGERSFNFAHADRLEKIDVRRKEGQLISVGGGVFQVMDSRSYEMVDAEVLNDDVAAGIGEGDVIIFMEVEGRSIILEKKPM